MPRQLTAGNAASTESSGKTSGQPGQNTGFGKSPEYGENPGTRKGCRSYRKKMYDAVFSENGKAGDAGKSAYQNQKQRMQQLYEKRQISGKAFHGVRAFHIQQDAE